MKNFKHFVLVASFAALAVTGLNAQSIGLRAEIPFDFNAGNKLMPAGEYVIQAQGPFILVRQADGAVPVLALMTFGAGSRDIRPRPAHLEFNRYGDRYFLTQVWNSFTQSGRQVVPTAREKELAKSGEVPVQALIILASN